MTLEQLYNETEKDLAPLNKELLEVEASNQASLHDKYLKLFIQSGAEYRMIKQKYEEMKICLLNMCYLVIVQLKLIILKQ